MGPHMAAAQCLLTAVGIAACVWLFALVKADLRAANSRWRQRQREAEAALSAVLISLSNLDKRIEENERQSGLLAPPPPVLSGFNLSKRSQAIRMSRRGETPPQIAAALRLPQGEVDLLLKVHRIVVSLPATPAPKGP